MTSFTRRTRRTRRALLGATAAGAALTLAACGGNVAGGADAAGAEFPTGPVTITVGQDAGGSTDLIARAVAEGMAEDLGVAVPVVNRAGANGALATEEVAAEPADGHELVLLNASLITITPLAVSDDEAVDLSNLDVLKGLSQDDYVLLASAESGFEDLKDLQDASGDITYGTTGVGTGSQLAQAALFAQAEIDGTAVPFDSGSPALTAVVGDQVQVATVQLGEAKPQIDAGKVVPLLAFSAERNQFLPDVPTAVEEGYDVPVSQYRAVAAPKGLPEDVKARLVESIDAATASETYTAFNENNLLTPLEISGEEVTTQWSELAEKYRALTDEYDISLAEG
ncbi:Tripartite-type tricarboxylate transporter, receptor component TctC [Promicromonospora umidemergens]|uniref:Tripartite tricarboxylate transporter substrate binding protein n=1 Tax=Promicromonospora umidemergens TaxID=629679 RepID=A0ABP8XUQ2_9MICO|nr:tripartite tricarboxylate transporter substrate binding protein [Promicromonospora umidemergens]MCP2286171.1 Tripartite-type tricarboxylate transporter, receptor component TctC [Promicromonospora umidemergens]